MLFYSMRLCLVLVGLVQGGTMPDSGTEVFKKLQNNNEKFFDLLRAHQRDADQSLQAFDEVLKNENDWVLSDDNSLKTDACLTAIKGERRNFGIFIGDHRSDFEKCVDQFVDSYKLDILNADIDKISTEATKCISIIRSDVFWKEYRSLHNNAKANCLSN